MVVLQELNQKLVELEAKLEETSKRKGLLRDEYELKIQNMLTEVFSNVLEEGDELSFSMSGTLFFKRPEEGYSYKKEVFTLYFRDNYKDPVAEEIQTSFYSTTENSEYELRRMVLIGEVGKILLNSKEDILAKYNLILKEFSEKSLPSSVWEIEKEIREVKDSIHLEEMKFLKEKLQTTGLEITTPEKSTLQISFQDVVRNVTFIKVDRITPSGKSADISIEYKSYVWDTVDEVDVTVIRKSTFTRIKMSYIEDFLQGFDLEEISDS